MQLFAQHRQKTEAAVVVLVALGVMLASCGRAAHSEQAEAQPLPQNDAANQHTLTVKFDYDFGRNPSCMEKPTLNTCVKQFNVYDVSGERFRLFTIPVPKGATGVVKSITGQSPTRVFLPGTHFVAVTAENAQGVESDVNAAKVNVEVKPKAPANGNAPAK